MSVSLARWLTEHRNILMPRWLEMLEPAPVSANGSEVVAHPDERNLLLNSMYSGIISAADGDEKPLNECLSLLRILRSTPGEDELSQQVHLTFQLRRAAWELLFSGDLSLDDARTLITHLEELIDYAATQLTAYWTDSAKAVTQQLQHAELLVASMAEESEQADLIALQLSKLNEIAQSLASSLDPAYLIDTVGAQLSEALGVAHVAIWLPDQDELRVVASWGEPKLPFDTRLSVAAEADLIVRAYLSHEAFLEEQPEPADQGIWYQPGCAVFVAPMLSQERATGVLVVQDPAPNERLGRSQQSFISSLASQSAIALENARLYEEVRGFNAVLEQRIAERTRELQLERDMLETLHQIALEVGSTLDLDSLLENSLRLLAELIGVEHGSVMLLEPDTGHLVDRAMLGRHEQIGYTRFTVGEGIVGWVAQHKKPTLVEDVRADPRWIALPESDSERKQSGSMIAVPLISQHELMGVLLLSHDEVGYFNEGHLRLLTASAGEIALGINNAMLYEHIQQQVMRQGEMRRIREEEASQSAAILQSLSDGVIVCNIEGDVILSNMAAERILGRSIEEMVTWNLPNLLERLLGRQAQEISVEYLLAHPVDEHGTPRHCSTSFQIDNKVVRLTIDPVISDKGEVMGAVTVFRDITAEVQSDRIKDEFIGTVSHELRTPMTSIKGFTQLLAMGSLGPVNDSQKEFLNTIHTNAERMISIINDLLDITKIETGSVELDLQPLHLAEALSNVVLELQPRIHEREHELSILIPPGLPLVRADARRFKQILFNLLSNAVKYTPRCGKVAIEAAEVTEEGVPEEVRDDLRPGRYVRIDVRDTGIGIAPDEIERIFERFYRTENPLKVEAGGTGLGLSLVRPLVRLLGGRMWVRSAPGEGSTFSFTLPAV